MKYTIYPDSYLMTLSRKKLVELLRQAEEEIESLEKANEDMYRACTEAEGKAADLELEVGELKEKIWDLEHSEDEYAETI